MLFRVLQKPIKQVCLLAKDIVSFETRSVVRHDEGYLIPSLSVFSHNTGRTQWEDPRKQAQNPQQDVQSMKSLSSSYSVQDNNEGMDVFYLFPRHVHLKTQ